MKITYFTLVIVICANIKVGFNQTLSLIELFSFFSRYFYGLRVYSPRVVNLALYFIITGRWTGLLQRGNAKRFALHRLRPRWLHRTWTCAQVSDSWDPRKPRLLCRLAMRKLIC